MEFYDKQQADVWLMSPPCQPVSVVILDPRAIRPWSPVILTMTIDNLPLFHRYTSSTQELETRKEVKTLAPNPSSI
jgi:hypothetical protein